MAAPRDEADASRSGPRGGTRPGSRVALAAAWIIVVGVLQSAFFIPRVPFWIAGATVAYAVLTFSRPFIGLSILAALGPIVNIGGQLWSTRVPWLGVLVLAFFAGWLPHLYRGRREPVPASAPLTFFAAVVVASMLVALSTLSPVVEALGSNALTLFFRDYFIKRPGFPAVQQGALLLEGVGLFTAGLVLTGRHPELRVWIARMMVVGAVAVAALTITRVVIASLQTPEPWTTFARHLSALRFNAAYSDVNATGSHMVLALMTCAGLVGFDRSRRIFWLPAAVLLMIALWLSGSRIAIVAALAALGALPIALVRLSTQRATRRAALMGVVAVLLVSATLYAYGPDRLLRSDSSRSMLVRVEMAATATRMLRTEPLFGVGIGKFYQKSATFSSPRLLEIYPRENAHNNYLQIGAELGIVGLAAFLWLLWTALAKTSVLDELRRNRFAEAGLLLGLWAFLLTAIVGHPLLTPEVAYPFWMMLGVAAGAAPHLRSSTWGPSIPARRVVPVLLVMLVLALPWRIHREMQGMDLEHMAFGVSLWTPASEGPRTRTVGRHAITFVPADVKGVEIPLRAISGAETGPAVDIWLNGRPANRYVTRGEWQLAKLIFPGRPDRRFYRVDLFVSGPPDSRPADDTVDAGVQMGWIKLLR
jgi:O-antigen ligase